MKLVLSSRKRRIAAFIIDHFAITGLMVSVTFLTLGPDFMNQNNMNDFEAKLPMVLIPGFLLYFGKDSFQGVSPGKWTMGIVVRNQDNREEIPSFGRLFLRNLFIIIWPVEFLVLAITRIRKGLVTKSQKPL